MLPVVPLLALAANQSPAAPADAGRIVAVSLFKNGFASVTREIALVGNTATVEVPPVSLGTLFFTSDDPSVVTVEALPGVSGPRRVALQTIGDLLRANVGRRVALTLSEGGGTAEGEIVAAGREVVTVRTANGQRILPIARVIEIAPVGGELRLEVEVPGAVPPKSYRVTKSHKGGKVRMTSLEPGLAWIPAYRVDVSEPAKATVVAQSTIFNEAYDLKAVRARLVSGAAAARYRNVPEPLVTGSALPDWLRVAENPEAAPPLRRDVASAPAYGPIPATIDYISFDPTDNSILVPPGYGSGGMGGGFGGGGGIGAGFASNRGGYSGVPEGGGAGEELGELFFYEIPPLTMIAGARRLQNLFRFEAPYRDLYRFEIGPDYDENLNPITRNQSDGYQSGGRDRYGRPLSDEDRRALREAVVHELEIQNRAGQPLTGAVASVVRDGELLGQGELDYAPKGGKATLRLERALDLVLDRREEVLSREEGAVPARFYGGKLDRLTVRGTISVRNPRTTPVILVGRKRTVGEMTLATPNGKITQTPALFKDINGASVAEWEVTVAPGETATLSYTYLLLARR